jgi:hypothetical protein
MKIRAILLSFALAAMTTAAAGCGASPNKVMADTPALPYEAPDIAEITGMEEDEDDDESTDAPSPAPAPAPSPAAATPAPAPAGKAPAKQPAAKAAEKK